ncbi:VirD4-like conjugal transfer protein, CD1115 family [Senegalimassilia anaerobia]|uniref:Conjugal transfer protein TraG n=1 Tax=Senegalimassilia anaerobia TaxID=1473216 RepID=A0A369L684_9ACTN|nr:type IV secretory system conjugative DNA transfer family protein [Senegalimassilia anaerobia]RDB54834.1 hypothetical protein C1880_08285 [Senegalimassilia anaerobia]
MLKNNTPAFAANAPTDPAGAAERSAYQGSMLLTANRTADTDTWRSGLNNNVLVLGSSGCGKTRNHLKPNLLQAQGSYIVLDSKGILYREMAPYLRKQGYQVDQLDFVGMNGTLGYNPLDHIRCQDGHPAEQDIIAIASALCPREDHESDPFWALAAANYLTSYIAYVLEAMPEQDRTMAEVIRVFDEACSGHVERLFDELERKNPGSYAVKLRRRAQTTIRAERMHASIVGIIAANLLPLGFTGAMAAYQCPRRVDFHEFGRKRCALFVTIDDMDTSLRPLTSLFIRQAFSSLCDAADHGSPDGRLAVPVRLMLDDFANLNVANFDNILSVTRSREISCTIVCQTVSQLEARYGKPAANSIIGNCDHQLVLGFQDEATARYFSLRANKPAASLLATPTDRWWLFQRGHAAVCDKAYKLERHPRYADLAACGQAEPGADLTEMWLDDINQEFFDFEELGPEDLELFGDANAA